MDIGGQAVIEGVLLRSPTHVAIAVRKPDNSVAVKCERFVSVSERVRILKLPVLRGIIAMYEMLRLGIRGLLYSAEQAAPDDEKLSDAAKTFTIALAFIVALALFVALPYVLTVIAGISEEEDTLLFNLVDGIIKVAFLVGYLYAISRLKEVQTLFRYHGAEHQVVNAYETNPRTWRREAMRQTTAHPRCGTSFILIVFLIMLVIFSLLPSVIYGLFPQIATLSLIQRKLLLFCCRLLVLVPVIGLSYEVLKLSGRHRDNRLVRVLLWPGLAFQRLTTKRPTERQRAVAIAAMQHLMRRSGGTGGSR